MNHSIEIMATAVFALAVIHTFSVKIFQGLAKRFPQGSVGENLFHLLGEVEVVFGLWSFILFILLGLTKGFDQAKDYINNRNFDEPLFVFAVMVVASTKPIIDLATISIRAFAQLLPFQRGLSFYLSCLIIGPLLGSFITEPAAMTVTSMILLNTVFKNKISLSLKYATLGLLFVNVSIGGTLTHFAAPPVVMVAHTWGWDSTFMFGHFGWKATLAIFISTLLLVLRFQKELRSMSLPKDLKSNSPFIMSIIHLLFLALIVYYSHYPKLFISLLLLFLGLATVTKEYQTPIKLKEGLLVGFFLGGLVTLGGLQTWWISPLVSELNSLALYLSATGLTSIFDNAALTYLGSLVPTITETSKYALVAGSVVGGGLTVIANAPNPIGYGLLNPKFGDEGINPWRLLQEALIPTLVAGFCFWIL